MGTVLEQTPYQCDQCGATNIVAAPVLYQQGTHTPIPRGSVRAQPNLFPRKQQRRRIHEAISAPCCSGEFQFVLRSFGGWWALLGFSIIPERLKTWEAQSLFF